MDVDGFFALGKPHVGSGSRGPARALGGVEMICGSPWLEVS